MTCACDGIPLLLTSVNVWKLLYLIKSDTLLCDKLKQRGVFTIIVNKNGNYEQQTYYLNTTGGWQREVCLVV